MKITALLIIIIAVYHHGFGVDLPSKLARHSGSYQKAIAILKPTTSHSAYGTFHFVQTPNGVRVNAILSGLTPSQNHGVHIHEYGDISDNITGASAGGHYNPEKKPHGLPPNPNRHAGSFGNILANEKGEAMFDFLDTTITIAGVKNPIIGRTVVVHANPDTGEQPAGNAGPRIAMGVIGVARSLSAK